MSKKRKSYSADFKQDAVSPVSYTHLDVYKRQVSDEELREQRISFAFGNALSSETITKESVRNTSQHVRLL